MLAVSRLESMEVLNPCSNVELISWAERYCASWTTCLKKRFLRFCRILTCLLEPSSPACMTDIHNRYGHREPGLWICAQRIEQKMNDFRMDVEDNLQVTLSHQSHVAECNISFIRLSFQRLSLLSSAFNRVLTTSSLRTRKPLITKLVDQSKLCMTNATSEAGGQLYSLDAVKRI
eukprot:683734-Hanusia_phi.AAC.2